MTLPRWRGKGKDTDSLYATGIKYKFKEINVFKTVRTYVKETSQGLEVKKKRVKLHHP